MKRVQRQARPTRWIFNPSAPLADCLLFAGLGIHPGTPHYQDSCLYGSVGALTGYSGAGDTPSDRWQWDSYLGRYALSFDGTDDYVHFANTNPWNFDYTEKFSVAFWLNCASGSYGNGPSFIGRLGGASTYTGWEVGKYPNSGGFPNCFVMLFDSNYSTGNAIAIYSSGVPTSGGWCHFAFTYNGNGLYTGVAHYINGKLTSNASVVWGGLTSSTKISNGLDIGRRYSGGNQFAGSISDPLIYGRVLTPEQVCSLADPANVMLDSGRVPLLLPAVRRRGFAVASVATSIIPHAEAAYRRRRTT